MSCLKCASQTVAPTMITIIYFFSVVFKLRQEEIANDVSDAMIFSCLTGLLV